MFGFNNISIDKKSRFSFPAKYRDAFVNSNENQIVITKDPQYPALKVYFGSEWDQISNKLSSSKCKKSESSDELFEETEASSSSKAANLRSAIRRLGGDLLFGVVRG